MEHTNIHAGMYTTIMEDNMSFDQATMSELDEINPQDYFSSREHIEPCPRYIKWTRLLGHTVQAKIPLLSIQFAIF